MQTQDASTPPSQQIRIAVLTIANAFCKATGMSLSAVSRKYYGKHGFLDDYAHGRQSITPPKLDDFLAKLSADWPEDSEVKWPKTAPIRMHRPEKLIPNKK